MLDFKANAAPGVPSFAKREFSSEDGPQVKEEPQGEAVSAENRNTRSIVPPTTPPRFLRRDEAGQPPSTRQRVLRHAANVGESSQLDPAGVGAKGEPREDPIGQGGPPSTWATT